MSVTDLKVFLDQQLLHLIQVETAEWMPNETGGILMGRKTDEKIYITDIIGPGPAGGHEIAKFIPDNDFHEAEIAKIYRESKGAKAYLGDWHSHPLSSSYLSSLDKQTLRHIANFKAARLPEPLMLVIGTFPLQIKVWQYKRPHRLKTNTIQELPICLY